MEVTVTQEDIDNGRRVDACNCPIARAFNRALGVGWLTSVSQMGVHTYRPSYGGSVKWFNVPQDAAVFMNTFDSGQSVSPATFDFTER